MHREMREYLGALADHLAASDPATPREQHLGRAFTMVLESNVEPSQAIGVLNHLGIVPVGPTPLDIWRAEC